MPSDEPQAPFERPEGWMPGDRTPDLRDGLQPKPYDVPLLEEEG